MEYSKFFICEYRDGEPFIYLCNAPNSLLDFVERIHHELGYDIYPNSWVLDVLKRCFEVFEESPSMIEPLSADIHMGDLIDWLRVPNAREYCDNILKNSIEIKKDFKELVQAAQEEAMFDIYIEAANFAEAWE